MQIFLIFFLCLIVAEELTAQKRYLISPTQEAIPVSNEHSATGLLNSMTGKDAACNNYYGIVNPQNYSTWQIGAYHRDVLGQWYVAPVTGLIDTIFFATGSSVGSIDSLIYLRVHRSNIGPAFGPGVRPGPYDPPCQSWGYWRNTNDPDMGVAAFIEEATDTAWVSTIQNSATPSTPPFGEELWGSGGFPVTFKPNSIHAIAMSELFPLEVNTSDVFFISIRVGMAVTSHGEFETTTRLLAKTFEAQPTDPEYPSRIWKFYEHDKGPSNCGDLPVDSAKRGWFARGGSFLSTDSLTVGLLDIWYSMITDSNTPPAISLDEIPQNSFNVGPREVSAVLQDCNNAEPGNAGISEAAIQYTVDDVSQPDIAMTQGSGDEWSGTIPPYPTGSEVRYKVKATDLDGAVSYSQHGTFKILEFGSDQYSIDTAVTCVMQDIRSSGTTIPPGSFFDAPNSESGSAYNHLDNGTAGPFDMGGNFVVFGDTFRYAWIGVNGGIALSKSTTDTIDVNADGAYSPLWDFPHPTYSDRYNTGSQMPPMFIAPLSMDLILGDSSATYGRIVYGNNGDPCKFIVEWDSLDYVDHCASCQNTFRVVFNRCDGTIEFQYEDVIAKPLLAGLQGAESTFTYGPLFINKDGFPVETAPRDQWCIRMTSTIGSAVLDGWNMVSVPCEPVDGNWTKIHLFPQATSEAFSFNQGFIVEDTLEMGKGYWMKFNGAQWSSGVTANTCSTFTFHVHDGWNMIGSISCPVAISSIVPGGGSTVSSPYYGYSGGYFPPSVILPGQAYWVRVAGGGTITLSCSPASAIPKFSSNSFDVDNINKIIVTDAAGNSQQLYIGEEEQFTHSAGYYELPPTPPAGAFDVRFKERQSMVETYQQNLNGSVAFPVAIQSAIYPLTISWEIQTNASKKFELIAGGKTFTISGNSSTTVNDTKINAAIIKVSGFGTPVKFALSQNYPNPFNPVTQFTIDIASPALVEIGVFDILGRKITTLLNAERDAGSYEMEWNGTDLQGKTVPTGMYFIRMTAGEFTDSKKVIFMK